MSINNVSPLAPHAAPPMVSIVIPVLNAARLLPRCLASIQRQDYPNSAREILIADGGSTDDTRTIAASFGATILENPQRRAEPGKQVGFAQARGTYIALLDADNEIASPDWLTRAITALETEPGALGFESYYLKKPGDSRLNRYVTGLLQVSTDPLVRTLARPLKRLRHSPDGMQVFQLPADGAYPTGANGFIFRRRLLDDLGSAPYHEASFFPDRIRAGIDRLVKIEGCGIHHYYTSGWRDYFFKRRYTMVNYLLRKEEFTETWEGKGGGPRLWLALAYHAAILPAHIEGLLRALRTGDPDWLLHGPAACVALLGNAFGAWDYRKAGTREQRSAASVRLHQQAQQQKETRHHEG